jgi:hypothetical protein
MQVVEQMVCRFSRSPGRKTDLFSVSLIPKKNCPNKRNRFSHLLADHFESLSKGSGFQGQGQ